MDKKEPGNFFVEDVTRESLIAISYGVPDEDPTAEGLPKRVKDMDTVDCTKVHMFGNLSIVVTTAEACRKVLTDDECFKPGWPSATVKLIGKKSFVGLSHEEHRWLRKLTAAPINGPELLSIYIKYIEENVVKALEKWEGMGQIEFLTELRRLTFKVIMHIFLSSEGEDVRELMEREYTSLNYGVRAMQLIYLDLLITRRSSNRTEGAEEDECIDIQERHVGCSVGCQR